ncbi:hypothetical protein [Streptomyces echinatus]|uniref:Tetratricopeptide repeat protein n=1 Tax=Streptomyces echinatus TaxID=67293 RepID=A0A7W9USE8_9ACTN|nr:hypothetical protein [Streptomyces echinatus]MBB5929417.1 hypothetical protein [Streptomyces echinatus]
MELDRLLPRLAPDERDTTDDAIMFHTTARTLFRVAADPHGEATEESNIGDALRQTGRVDEAMGAYGRSPELFREHEDRYGQGVTLDKLADVHVAAHRPAEARAAAESLKQTPRQPARVRTGARALT